MTLGGGPGAPCLLPAASASVLLSPAGPVGGRLEPARDTANLTDTQVALACTSVFTRNGRVRLIARVALGTGARPGSHETLLGQAVASLPPSPLQAASQACACPLPWPQAQLQGGRKRSNQPLGSATYQREPSAPGPGIASWGDLLSHACLRVQLSTSHREGRSWAWAAFACFLPSRPGSALPASEAVSSGSKAEGARSGAGRPSCYLFVPPSPALRFLRGAGGETVGCPQGVPRHLRFPS